MLVVNPVTVINYIMLHSPETLLNQVRSELGDPGGLTLYPAVSSNVAI